MPLAAVRKLTRLIFVSRISRFQHVGVFGTCFSVHPNNVGSYTEEVHNFLIQLATEDRKKYKLVAIGECGIDFYR